jgi:hypothetical protein
MKAVKCKNNHISLINTLEAKLYNLAETMGHLIASELSERDAHIAEELHQKNIFDKQTKNGKVTFSIYSTKQNI